MDRYFYHIFNRFRHLFVADSSKTMAMVLEEFKPGRLLSNYNTDGVSNDVLDISYDSIIR